jgi:hypothetical protein
VRESLGKRSERSQRGTFGGKISNNSNNTMLINEKVLFFVDKSEE